MEDALQITKKILGAEIERTMVKLLGDGEPRRWGDSRINLLWRRSSGVKLLADDVSAEDEALSALAEEILRPLPWCEMTPPQRVAAIRAAAQDLLRPLRPMGMAEIMAAISPAPKSAGGGG